MSRSKLYLLGPPRLEVDGEPVHIGRRKALALLVYLAMERGDRGADASPLVHSRDALATLLWPDYDQSNARGRLRRTLSELARTLGVEWFVADRETVGLNPDADLWLDAEQFHQALAACEGHGHQISEPCAECLARLTEAEELYRDDFMSGFTLPDSLEFDEWQHYQAESLRDELASALERLVNYHSKMQDYEAAIAYARRWLALDRLEEPAHRALMELYVQAGRRSAALRQYRQCVRSLEEELGVPPSPETTALYERIRAEGVIPAEPLVAKPTSAPPHAVPAFLSDDARTTERTEVFVARDAELGRLNAQLARALAGQGRVVFVTGGPGRGKSALMREFVRRAVHAHPDLLAAMGSCNAYSGMGDPYLPFREVLAMLTGDVEGRWAASVISTEHAHRLWAILPLAVQMLFDHDPHLIDVFLSGQALVSRALSVPSEGAEWLARLQHWVDRERGDRADLKPQYLSEQYANTLTDLAVEYPLVLILDDLQWADSLSASLLFHVGRRLAEVGGRVLIVGAYRPEEVALGRDEKQHPLEPVISEFKRRFGDIQVDLVQADQQMGRRFVDAFLESPANPLAPNRLGAGFRSALDQRTGGHPLFTVELLRGMQERGDLVQDADGVWVESADLDWGALPVRVEAVIEARVGRLNEELRDLLAVASVEGERFTAQVIAQVQGLPERDVLRALARELGTRHRLVREAGEVRVAAASRILSHYQFAHALFQAYLYDGISAGELRLLHGEVGAALETVYGAGRDEIAVPLAHHFTKAGQGAKAAEYLVQAGNQARLAYAFEEAERHFTNALELLSSLSPTERAKTARSRLLALKGLGLVHFASGQSVEAEEYLRQAIALGKEIDMAPRDLVRMYFWLGEVLYWQGRFDERLRIGEEGLALLADDSPSVDGVASTGSEGPAEALESVEAALMFQLIAGAHNPLGNREKFLEFTNRSAQFVQRLPYTEELRPVYEGIVMAQWEDKDPEETTKWLCIFEEQAVEHHDLNALVGIHGGLASPENWGDLRGAILELQQGLATLTKIGDARYAGHYRQVIGEYLLYMGDLKRAELYTRRALDTAKDTGFMVVLARAYWDLGRIALCQGAWEETVEACQTALELFRQTHKRGLERWTICTLGRTHLAQDDREEALRRFQEAIALPSPKRQDNRPGTPPAVLGGLEEAYVNPEPFRAFCRRFREVNPRVSGLPLVQWFLEPAAVVSCGGAPLQHYAFESALSLNWVWHDPYGDCTYVVQNGLEIHAANWRDLWSVNLSAPRVLRPAPEGRNWAAQSICSPVSADKPSIGGLLLWKDRDNYLRLDWGTGGKYEIVFHGCLNNRDLIIGRGRLSMDTSNRVFLRLERMDARVNALCSADGAEWFTVGHITFPVEDPVQIGLHAIGNIDRTVYHGAYPEGTAIRFESFTLWGLDH